MPHAPSRHPDRAARATGLTLKPARALAVVAAIVATLALLTPYPAVTASASDLDGKAIFMAEKCNLCHSMPAVGIEATVKSDKMRGPDLPTAEEAEDKERLLAYLRQDAEIDGEKHKKAFKGSDEELGAMVQWIESLREEQGEEDSDGGR